MSEVFSGFVKAISQNKGGYLSICVKPNSGDERWYQVGKDGSKEAVMFGGNALKKGTTITAINGTEDQYGWKATSVTVSGNSSSGGGGGGYKKSGGGGNNNSDRQLAIKIGNSINVATNMMPDDALWGDIAMVGTTKILPIALQLAKDAAAKYPTLDEGNVGAKLGQALLLASGKMKGSDDYAKLGETAGKLLGLLIKSETTAKETMKAEADAKAKAEADAAAGNQPAPAAETPDDDIPF